MRYITACIYPKVVGLLLMVVLDFSSSFAQSYNYTAYEGLYSRGNIPEDMRKTVKELYDEDRSRMEQYTDKRKSRRSKGVLECSYAITKMVQGGRILYGDPITLWINQVADTLLKNNPKLRNDLRFYTYKSTAVNAFATGQGMIFVSTGLVARLQNEAQMAYILSHEIVHYVNNHTWESISAKTEEGRRRNADLDKIINKHNRSHRMEMEADSLGLVLYYLPSNYYNKVADGVMDILLRSDYAAQNIPFDTSYFNSQYYKLPADVWLKTVTALDMDEDKPDSASTHPNIGKRRSLACRITASQPERGEKQLCVNEQDFEQIRYLAQMETIRQLVITGAYIRAFYDSWCLLKQYPDNTFLSKAMAYSLYAMAKYKTATNTNDMIGNYNDEGGEIQQLYHCFGKMKSADINVLAVRELYKYRQKYGPSKHLNKITAAAVQMLVKDNSLGLSYFSSKTPETGQQKDNEKKPVGKYERLKKGGQTAAKVADMRKYAFTDLLIADEGFAEMFIQCLKDTVVELYPDGNVLVLSPSYRCYNNRGELDIKSSERNEEDLSAIVAEAFGRAGRTATEYSDNLLRKQTSDTFYNQYMVLNEWMREIDIDVDIQLMSQPEADKIFEAYNVNNVAIAGVSTTAWRGFGGRVIPTPYLFYSAIAERCGTTTAYVEVDRSGKINESKVLGVQRNDEKAFLKQSFYSSIAGSANPGYMGKHLLVGVSASGFLSANINDYEIDYTVGLEYGVRVEGVVGRKISLVGAMKRYGWNSSVINNFELGVRTYTKSATAPLGPYLQLSLQGRMLDGDFTTKAIQSENDKYLGKISFAPAFTLGRTYIFWDNIQMDLFYGISFPFKDIEGCDDIVGLYLNLGLSISWLVF